MADLRFNVETRYTVNGAQAIGQTNALSAASRRLTTTLAGVAAAYLGIRAVAGIIKETVSQFILVEQAVLNVAGSINRNMILSTNATENFNRSVEMSRETIKGLALDARKLPGELADFIEIFQSVGPTAIAGGVPLADIRKLVGQAAIVGSFTGEDLPQVARDLQFLMAGRFSRQEKLTRNLLAQGVLKDFGTKGGFSELSVAQRFKTITDAIGKLADDPNVRKVIETLFVTQFSTLKDALFGFSGLLGAALKPTFDFLRDKMIQVNVWIVKNQDRLNEMARTVGQRLVGALSHAKQIMEAMLVIATAQVALRLSESRILRGNAIMGAVGGLSGFRAAGGIGRGLNQIGLGSVSAAGAPGAFAAGGAAAAGVAAVRAPGFFAAGGLGATLSRIGGGLARLGAPFLRFAGRLALLLSVIDAFRSNFLGIKDELKDAFGDLAAVLGRLAGDPALQEIGRGFRAIGQAIGTIPLGLLVLLARLLEGLAVAIEFTVDTIREAFNSLPEAVRVALGDLPQAQGPSSAGGFSGVAQLPGGFGPLPTGGLLGDLAHDLAVRQNTAGTRKEKGDTIINGGIKIIQTFKDEADPDRIATAVTSALHDISINPLQAKTGAKLGRAI